MRSWKPDTFMLWTGTVRQIFLNPLGHHHSLPHPRLEVFAYHYIESGGLLTTPIYFAVPVFLVFLFSLDTLTSALWIYRLPWLQKDSNDLTGGSTVHIC